MRGAVLLFVGVCLVSPPAGALTGNTLYEHCKEKDKKTRDNFKYGACIGYTRGLIDGHEQALKMLKESGEVAKYCMNESVTLEQTIDVILKYLSENPKDRHWGAEVLGLYALILAFPCPPPSAK